MQHVPIASLRSCGRSGPRTRLRWPAGSVVEMVARRPFSGYGRTSKEGPFGLYRWYRTRSRCGLTLVRMPLEGQWARQTTPVGALPKRARRTLAIVLAILAAATAVTVGFALVHSDSASAGCIRVAT